MHKQANASKESTFTSISVITIVEILGASGEIR